MQRSLQEIKKKLTQFSALVPNGDKMPVYRFLAQLIIVAVENGLWNPGDLIPPEHFFAQELNVSLGTVKRAMLELVNNGILYRRRGSGTYVADFSFSREMRRYYLFLEDFHTNGNKNKYLLLSRNIVPAQPEINELLGLAPDAKLIELTRTIEENGRRIALTHAYYEAVRFADIMTIPVSRLERVPLFLILEKDFNVRADAIQELFGVTPLNAASAGLLNVAESFPALTIKSLTSVQDMPPFEYRICYSSSYSSFLYRSIKY